METFDVAHIREQGQDIIIVVVNHSFSRKIQAEQREITAWLQQCASSAGLAGTVVPIWDAGHGKMGYFAPPMWQAFFNSLSLGVVARNINKKLRCS